MWRINLLVLLWQGDQGLVSTMPVVLWWFVPGLSNNTVSTLNISGLRKSAALSLGVALTIQSVALSNSSCPSAS